MRENIATVFGSKFLATLNPVDIDIVDDKTAAPPAVKGDTGGKEGEEEEEDEPPLPAEWRGCVAGR